MDNPVGRRSFRWQVLSFTLLAFGLRFYRLGFHSLWMDEALTVHDAGHPFREIPNVILASPPLFHFIIRIFYLVFGRSDFWLRVPSAFFGTLTVPLIILVARRFYGERAAFWAGALMTVSVFDVFFSQEVRMYSLVALEALVSMVLWTEAMDTRQPKLWILYGLVSLLGLFTHNWFPLLVLAQGGWWLIQNLKNRRMDGPGFCAFLGVTILYGPWLLMVKRQLANPCYSWLTVPDWKMARETLYSYAGIRVFSGDSWLGVGTDARLPFLVLSSGFLIWGLVFRDEKRALAIRTFLVGCLLPVGTAFLVSVFIRPIYMPGRYPILGLPAYLLTVARGFQGVPVRYRRAAVCLGILWIGVSLYLIGRYYWFYEKSPWKRTCQWILRQTSASDPLYLNVQAANSTFPIEYYLASRRVVEIPVPDQGRDKPIYSILEKTGEEQFPMAAPSRRAVAEAAHFGRLTVYKTRKS